MKMKTFQLIIILFVVIVSLFFFTGCGQTPDRISLDIKVAKPKNIKSQRTVPISVRKFVDVRKKVTKDMIGYYDGVCLQSKPCFLNNFESTVTKAFQDGLKNSGATVVDYKDGGVVLTGNIEQYFAVCQAEFKGVRKYESVGHDPLKIKLTLSDYRGRILWKGEVVGSYKTDILWDLIWTPGHFMKFQTEKCILKAVENLLSDKSFRAAVSADNVTNDISQ